MMYVLKKWAACFLIVFPAYSIAQDAVENNKQLDIRIETAGTYTDGNYAPFWITSNNDGIGSEWLKSGYVRTGVFGAKKTLDNKLNVAVGADILVARNLLSASNVYIQQLYADFRYKIFGLSAGMKERRDLFRNERLSSGRMTLSTNARPIPQVEIGFPQFVPVPYTNDWLQIQGSVSYGWFTDDNYKKRFAGNGKYTENALYHRKYAYFKIEKNTPWYFVLGLEMDTQWGGDFYLEHKYADSSPAGIIDFFKVIIPMSGGGNSNQTDQVNIQGNVYGSWHFIFNYKVGDYSIRPYYEHFFEDHSGMFFKNMPDGIYGLELNLHKKRLISSVVLEYIHTKDQSGPFLWDRNENIPIQVSFGDDYYNTGYDFSNYGLVMGNPLLTSPIYNNGKTLYILNNRISAFHGGISGYLADELKYRAMLTYSKSWGTLYLPSRKIRTQFSSLLEMEYTPARLKNWTFSGALGYDDSSSMVGNNLGVKLKIAKQFRVY